MELVLEGNHSLMPERVSGALVSSTCQNLRDTIMELSATGRNNVMIDLAEAPYLDTSGIGVLIGLKATLSRRGGSLNLRNLPPKVAETFRMMRLDKLFNLSGD